VIFIGPIARSCEFHLFIMEIARNQLQTEEIIILQAFARVSECFTRMSQTVQRLSQSSEPLFHNMVVRYKKGDSFPPGVESLLKRIEDSAKDMERLSLTIERNFLRIERLLQDVLSHRYCLFSDVNISGLSFDTMNAISENLSNNYELLNTPSLYVESPCEEKTLKRCTDETEVKRKFDFTPLKHCINEHKTNYKNMARTDDPLIKGNNCTKNKISFLEQRLTSWIKEIEDIDVQIEKSIELSKTISCRR